MLDSPTRCYCCRRLSAFDRQGDAGLLLVMWRLVLLLLQLWIPQGARGGRRRRWCC